MPAQVTIQRWGVGDEAIIPLEVQLVMGSSSPGFALVVLLQMLRGHVLLGPRLKVPGAHLRVLQIRLRVRERNHQNVVFVSGLDLTCYFIMASTALAWIAEMTVVAKTAQRLGSKWSSVLSRKGSALTSGLVWLSVYYLFVAAGLATAGRPPDCGSTWFEILGTGFCEWLKFEPLHGGVAAEPSEKYPKDFP